MEAARAMLHDQDLPMHLWAEDARIVVYVQNCSSHRVLENKTPEEVFSGKKPEVIHLRIFGYPVYIHIPKEKRTKLDPLGRRVYLWDTLKSRRLTEYTSQDSRRSTLAGMGHLLGRAPQRSLRIITGQRICKRRLTQNSLRGVGA